MLRTRLVSEQDGEEHLGNCYKRLRARRQASEWRPPPTGSRARPPVAHERSFFAYEMLLYDTVESQDSDSPPTDMTYLLFGIGSRRAGIHHLRSSVDDLVHKVRLPTFDVSRAACQAVAHMSVLIARRADAHARAPAMMRRTILSWNEASSLWIAKSMHLIVETNGKMTPLSRRGWLD